MFVGGAGWLAPFVFVFDGAIFVGFLGPEARFEGIAPILLKFWNTECCTFYLEGLRKAEAWKCSWFGFGEMM